LKIHHALKETSYPTDWCSMAGFGRNSDNYWQLSFCPNQRAAGTGTGSYRPGTTIGSLRRHMTTSLLLRFFVTFWPFSGAYRVI
jgi:hypothetical protein